MRYICYSVIVAQDSKKLNSSKSEIFYREKKLSTETFWAYDLIARTVYSLMNRLNVIENASTWNESFATKFTHVTGFRLFFMNEKNMIFQRFCWCVTAKVNRNQFFSQYKWKKIFHRMNSPYIAYRLSHCGHARDFLIDKSCTFMCNFK